MATFVYSMVVLRDVKGGSGGQTFVPKIAVTGGLVLVLLSVAFFIRYLGHVLNLIRVATVIQSIGDETRRLIGREIDCDPAIPDLDRVIGGRGGPQLGVPRPGVLVSVNARRLAQLAENADCTVVLEVRVGDFVPAGAPLLRLVASGATTAAALADLDDGVRQELLSCVAFDRERTSEQDIAFGLRQLVDIAERALSPGVNDPTTASQSIDQIHDLLRRLAARPDPSGIYCGGDGRPRLVLPQYRFADYVEFVVGEIWRYGATAAQIPARLALMLSDLARVATEENAGCLEPWLVRVSPGAAPEVAPGIQPAVSGRGAGPVGRGPRSGRGGRPGEARGARAAIRRGCSRPGRI